MRRIYLDNAATSYPKPKCVVDSYYSYAVSNGSSSNRSENPYTFEADEKIFDLREKLKEILNLKDGFVSFTFNATTAINYVLYSFLNANDHVLISCLEHNSVVRSLNELKVDYDLLSSDEKGQIIVKDIKYQIKPNTKALVIQSANNVFATVQDIEKIKNEIKDLGIELIVDASQSLPYLDINMEGISALIAAGHKGLMAMMGTAIIAVNNSFVKKINKCLIAGATGSKSNDLNMMKTFPEYFEAGTQNVPALISFYDSLEYIYSDIKSYREKILKLSNYLDEKLRSLDDFIVFNFDKRIPVYSIAHKTQDNADVSNYLTKCGFQHRLGLHCTSLSHKYFSTNGTIRFSFSIFNSFEELDLLIDALKNYNSSN